MVGNVKLNTMDLEIFQAAGGNPFFQVDPGLAIWTWIVFFLLLGILYKFAWKPILKSLDDREGKINASLVNAEKIEASLSKTKEENRKILNEAREEAQRIIKTSREISESEKVESKKRVEKEAQEMIEKTRVMLEQERKKAIEQLREESVRIGVEIAGKLMEENLDSEKNLSLSKKYMEEMVKY